MKNISLLIAVIVVCIIGVIFYYCYFTENYVQYKSSYDGREYNVIDKYSNHKEAAELLARSNETIIHLYEHLRTKYQIYWPTSTDEELADKLDISIESLTARKNAVRNLLKRYNPDVIYETNPLNIHGETSSTIKKGEKMNVCIRYRENPEKLVPYHVLIYVLLHEIGHVAADVWGHPPEFWQIFKFILNEAYDAKLWTPINYREHPEKYCGIMVHENTFLDEHTTSI